MSGKKYKNECFAGDALLYAIDRRLAFEYDQKCAGIYLHEASGRLAIGSYEIVGDLLPETDEQLPQKKETVEELIRRSLADGHDYLLDYAKEHGVKIVYDPDKEY